MRALGRLRDRLSRLPVWTAGIVVLLAVSVALAPLAGGTLTQTVTVADGTVEPGEHTQVPVVLSSAPDGLAGADVTVQLSNPSVAEISSVSIPDQFGPTNATVSQDGSTVRVQFADVEKSVQPGASGVRLATLTLAGSDVGQSSLRIAAVDADDDDGDPIVTATDSGSITVIDPNEKPVADAGADRSVTSGTTITLDATASTDEDGDSLLYSWTQVEGPAVSLSQPNEKMTPATLPSVQSATTLVFELTVSDRAARSTDQVTVTVQPSSGSPPPDDTPTPTATPPTDSSTTSRPTQETASTTVDSDFTTERPSETSESNTTDESTSSGAGPGFGVLATLLAVLGSALLIRLR